MTKEMHEMNSKATDFVAELIDYIFTYPNDDYMTMECLCRKLHKHGLIDKQDGKYTTDTPQADCESCEHKHEMGLPCYHCPTAVDCGWGEPNE